MPARAKPIAAIIEPAFWDTSAIVPLCCQQPQSSTARQAARLFGRQVVWWGTVIEAASALERLSREGHLNGRERVQAFAKLDYLRNRWSEVQPLDEVRDLAERLLRIHKLRSADALQLSAAQLWCSSRPRGRYFIGADDRLTEAAENEGFTVVRL